MRLVRDGKRERVSDRTVAGPAADAVPEVQEDPPRAAAGPERDDRLPSTSRSILLLPHDLSRKPLPTFRDHAPSGAGIRTSHWSRPIQQIGRNRGGSMQAARDEPRSIRWSKGGGIGGGPVGDGAAAARLSWTGPSWPDQPATSVPRARKPVDVTTARRCKRRKTACACRSTAKSGDGRDGSSRSAPRGTRVARGETDQEMVARFSADILPVLRSATSS